MELPGHAEDSDTQSQFQKSRNDNSENPETIIPKFKIKNPIKKTMSQNRELLTSVVYGLSMRMSIDLKVHF